MKRAYRFRIYPNQEQIIFFAKTFGCVRKTYNLMLEERLQMNEDYRNGLPTNGKIPTPAKYKEDYPYLKEVDSLALANAQLNLDRAFKNCYRDPKVGEPKYKSRKMEQSYTTNNQKGTISVKNHKYLKLPKLKSLVRIKMHRHPKGDIKSATISRSTTGIYHVSLLVEETIEHLPKTGSEIGIDLGLIAFAVLSDGRRIPNPRFTNQEAQTLKREQRKLSKRKREAKKRGVPLREAKNYQKQKLKVARIHEKIANRRNDFLNKVSKELIENHDVLCIETLKVKEMMKTKRVSKSIADVSWSRFVAKLEYKAGWYGKKVIKIDSWYPSSQLCSHCGYNDGKKPLEIRQWECSNCNITHDRDLNASINILDEGLRLSHQS
ncbi:transposase [Erysipelothrix larvae]|uniref:Transposase n=1 Tax=Erysipelothrix larvae TaxID=1514105 RepID=A0A0X8H1L6_9FIRM|nr:IS200/IS605 family element RNA-guided endonuclease TnpB [Erysipelothrix larvae]AMC94355.1 transposase [Erysipelothrix larvae]